MRSLSLAVVMVFALSSEAMAQEDVPEPPVSTFDVYQAIAEGPPLRAEEAARRAVDASPTLEGARALARASDASVARTRAAMLPRLDLSAYYMHVDGFPDGEIAAGLDPAALDAARTLAGSVSDPAARALWLGQIDAQGTSSFSIAIPRDRVGFSARLSWPASDFFFAMLPAIDAAEAGGRAREHEVAVVEAGVRRSAREAYLTLVRARGALAVTVEAVRQAAAQREQVEAALRAGFLTPADRLAVEARVAEAEQAQAMAEAAVVMADAGLRALMNADAGEVFGVMLDEVDEVDGATVEAALESRPEVAALREALVAQRAAARVADASGYPHLGIYAGADIANPSQYQIPPQQVFTPSWEIGARLTWSPNDTLSAHHRGEELAAQRAATQARLDQLERLIGLEVRQARARLEAARRGVSAADAALSAASAAYESRLAQVRAGNATTAALFAAEGQLNRARLGHLDAEVELRLGEVRLAHASGVR